MHKRAYIKDKLAAGLRVGRVWVRRSLYVCVGSAMLLAGCFGQGGAQGGSDTKPAESATAAASAAPTLPGTSGPSPVQASPKPTVQATPAEDPIRRLMSSMSLEEKIGQMILAGIHGTVMDENAKKMIREGRVGGIILYANNITDLKGMVTLVNTLKSANAGNSAPLFVSVDQEGGKVNRMPKEYHTLPSNGKVGKSRSTELAEDMGRLLARQLRSAGFNMDFAPDLDVNSNPNNPIIGDRSFAGTAEWVTKLGIAELKGFRSEGIIPVVKHYPGHGDTSVDSHLDLPVVNKTVDELKKLEWPPFEAAVREQAEAVMVAHILFPKLDPDKPASLSQRIIGQELRGRLGYKGVVITDDLGMGAIKKHYELAGAAVSSVQAGTDILLVAHGYEDARLVFDTLLRSVKQGTITEVRIEESVYRILSLKARYKMNDGPIPVPDLTKLNQDIDAWTKKLIP